MDDNSLSDSIWSTPEKILFRFFFIFFLLIIIIQNNGAFPFWEEFVMKYPNNLLHQFIPWIGKAILHIPYEIQILQTGSGDTTYDYVVVFFISITAVSGTLIWSLLDRNKANYSTLYYWLTVAIRFYVALMLFNYGMIKVVKLQFPSPGFHRLMETYGDSSPMGLAWTFLGFSTGYNLFMGIAEIAAVLLLFRRTMTFGAIITLMTTANVMAVNYFYDVPVKILSTTLFVMTLFLLLKNARNMFMFFFTNKTVSLEVIQAPIISKKWIRVTMMSGKFLVIGYALLYGAIEVYAMSKLYGDNAPKTKLYGTYNVKSFVVNNDRTSCLLSDSTQWKRLSIEWEGFASVKYKNDSVAGFPLAVDTVSQSFVLTASSGPITKFRYHYTIPDPEHFILKGKIGTDSISIYFIKNKNFKLTSRGFHWINEQPYNR